MTMPTKGGKKMEREEYVSPETEVIVFETEDVMYISGPEDVF